MDTRTVLKNALALNERDRAFLVEKLLETLDDTVDHPEETEFLEELERRSREVEQGTAELIPWPQLRDSAD